MKIESKTGKSGYSAKKIYSFISDFKNFKDIIPQGRISQWEATNDQCSFRMDPVGQMGMTIIEQVPFSLIKISSDPAISQYNFKLWIQLKETEESDTRIKITMEPQLNSILLTMVKPHLKQFVDSLIDQIETFTFGEV